MDDLFDFNPRSTAAASKPSQGGRGAAASASSNPFSDDFFSSAPSAGTQPAQGGNAGSTRADAGRSKQAPFNPFLMDGDTSGQDTWGTAPSQGAGPRDPFEEAGLFGDSSGARVGGDDDFFGSSPLLMPESASPVQPIGSQPVQNLFAETGNASASPEPSLWGEVAPVPASSTAGTAPQAAKPRSGQAAAVPQSLDMFFDDGPAANAPIGKSNQPFTAAASMPASSAPATAAAKAGPPAPAAAKVQSAPPQRPAPTAARPAAQQSSQTTSSTSAWGFDGATEPIAAAPASGNASAPPVREVPPAPVVSQTADTDRAAETNSRVQELEVENRALRARVRALEQHMKDQNARGMNVSDIIRGLCRNEPVPISSIRGLESKRALLAGVEETGNTDAILAVCLFLRDTVKADVFVAWMRQYSHSMGVYKSYLRQSRDFSRLENLQRMLGDTVQECLERLRHAYEDTRGRPLLRCAALTHAAEYIASNYGAHMQAGPLQPELELIHTSAVDACELMSRQIKIDKYDGEQERKGTDDMYVRHPRNGNVTGASLSATLQYCIFYHPTADKKKLSSPEGMVKRFGISDRKYTLSRLRQRAKLHDWDMIKGFTTHKGLFSSKTKSSIGFEPFVRICALYGAPVDVLEYFAMCITDADDRINISQEFHLHGALIATYTQQRNEPAMQELRSEIVQEMGLEGGRAITEKIDAALKDPKIKWQKGRKKSRLGFFRRKK